MAKYTQANRPLKVFTALGADAFLLTGFRGREAVSQLFSFELDLLAENATAIAFDLLLGQEVSVSLRLGDGSDRYFSGILRRLSRGDSEREFTSYRVELVPKFWCWTKRVQCRTFQQMTVADILRQVLTGLDVSFQLTQEYQRREYCVQYGESDFAFASRLMEEEGIHYYFRHTAEQHELVVSDNALTHPDVPGASECIYDRGSGGNRVWPRVTSWRKTQEIRAGKYTTWDYNFEMPAQHLEASASPRESVAMGQVSHKLLGGVNSDLEIFEYPGGYARHADSVGPGGEQRDTGLSSIFPAGQRTARLRAEAEAVAGLGVEAVSDAGQLLPGHVFSLARHSDANGKYLVTEVTHTAALSVAQGDNAVLEYNNRVMCLPAELPYRPARVTPKPTINGPQTATVVGVAGQATFLDKYGRVKVQFYWDRQGKKDADSSGWVRVAQIWAGKKWGAFFWPRIGHEVVVVFEEGDPDRPLIVGSVYNAVNQPPVDLPAEVACAGIKSCIIGSDPATCFNSLVFLDQVGLEFVVLHSHSIAMNNNVTDQYTLVPQSNVAFYGNVPGTGL